MLSRWIQQPGPSAFSEKKSVKVQKMLERRALLLQMEGSPPQEVAKALDDSGFKPQRYPSYTVMYEFTPNSFHVFISKERREARKVWGRSKRPPKLR